MCRFFLLLLLSFSSHTFSWVWGSLCKPRKIFSFCAFTCLSNNNSLISWWISAKLGSALPPCILYLSYCFQPKEHTWIFFERLLHCRLIFSITWTPDKWFAYTFSYTIYVYWCIIPYWKLKKNHRLKFFKTKL